MAAVRLDWDYVQGSDPAARFRVERQIGTAGAWSGLGEVQPVTPGQGSYSYTDTTAADGQSYSYRTLALNATGLTSPPSNVVTVTVPGILNAPTNLRGTVL